MNLPIVNYKLATRRGFTILELIIVVAIIAILVSVTITFLGDSRKRSRDTVRLRETREISTALDLYYTSENHYPTEAGETEAENNFIDITGNDYVSTALVGGGHIKIMPIDPLQIDPHIYRYDTDEDGSTFTLSFCLEKSGECKEIIR